MNIYRCSFPPCRAKSNGETKEELRARGWVFKRDEILCAAHATVQALFTVTGGGRCITSMKIGPFEFYWNPGPGTVAAGVRDYLAGAPEVRRAIARMARSEVKNYLARVAEEAGVPFSDPAEFTRLITSEERKSLS